jgi:hypothetical protein
MVRLHSTPAIAGFLPMFLAATIGAAALNGQVVEKLAEPKAPALLPGVERVLEQAKRENRAYETARTIAKEHPKRLTGSKGYDKSAAWAVERFKSYGLDAKLEKWGTFPIAFDRGAQKGRIVSPEEVALTFTTAAWSAGTQGAQRGPAVREPRTEAELTALDLRKDLAGAWIVRAGAEPEAGLRKKLREIYDEAGILGVVRAGPKSGLLRMGGNSRVDPKKLPKNVEIRVLAEQLDALVARLEKNEHVVLEFEIENVFTPGPVDCHNVVADIKGTRFPNEYVIVQAHLDAWDGAEGAQDNGTGCATALEAARLIAASGTKPLRTIRFVLYGGEEQGLLGSEGYVRDHKDELDETSVVFTHDAGGTFLAGIDATYAMLADLERVCAPLSALDPKRPFTVHEVPGVKNSGDSDHAPFIKAGVPSFFWHQSEIGYERVHHTQHDVFEEVDRGDLEHSAIVAAVVALGCAQLEHKLDRTDSKSPPRRLLGVQLEGVVVSSVTEEGRAVAAGWKAGDRILQIDGESVKTESDITDRVQLGGARKTFRLARGEETIESVLDWSDEKAEKERSARAERRAKFLAARRSGAPR